MFRKIVAVLLIGGLAGCSPAPEPTGEFAVDGEALAPRARRYLLGGGQIPEDVQVTVAPRALPLGPAIVRVFAVTNVQVPPVPELGLFLARLNFSMMFGRFSLDTEHNAIWFDETLLGEHFSSEELRFAVSVVSRTADEWDDRLKQMFGGMTYQEMLKVQGNGQTPPVKPGAGPPGFYL